MKLPISLLFLIFPAFVFAQDFQAIRQKIKSAVENRNYQTTLTELQNLEKTAPKIFRLNNYDYLLARMAERRGDFALAAANYQSAANRDSVLKEYALWHLAQIPRSSGNLMLERIYLREIQAAAPESLLLTSVNARLARSYFESKNYDSAIRLLNNQQVTGIKTTNNEQRTTDKRLARENLVLLGESYLQTGRLNEAREIFHKLTDDLPNAGQPDDFALAGVKGLDILDAEIEKAGKIAPELAEAEHLKRAQIYQFNRDFAAARLHYQAIVKNYPATRILPDVFYQIGRGLALEENFARAIDWFERVYNEFPDHPIAPDALSQAASAYARVNKPRESVARYQQIIENYPDYLRLDRAYLNIADVLRDSGSSGEALKWTRKTQEAFRGTLPEAIALFTQARIRISQNDWQNAVKDLEKLLTFADLGGTRVPGGTNKAEIMFLRGFALEQLNRFPEAIDVYLSIPDGRNEYYGWRATERLRFLAADEKSQSFINKKFEILREITKQNITANNAENVRQAAQSAIRLLNDAEMSDESLSPDTAKKEFLLNISRQTYAFLPTYQKLPKFKLLEFGRKEILRKEPENDAQNYHKALADELLFLGLYDEATPELETSQKTAGNEQRAMNNDLNYTLAVFYKRGDMAHRAVGFIEPLWRGVPADYQIELIPRDQAELLYPAPYADSLLRYAPARSVDPRFILAIMRQESRFRADVKSTAAARGLMQFISSTSDKIASELGRKNFIQDELYHPPTAVLFGSQYVSNLFKQFPAQPQAVAASYNGGESNMTRWLARSNTNNADRYVPEIVFSQTKDYVYKVMANYRVYRTLYDENLETR